MDISKWRIENQREKKEDWLQSFTREKERRDEIASLVSHVFRLAASFYWCFFNRQRSVSFLRVRPVLLCLSRCAYETQIDTEGIYIYLNEVGNSRRMTVWRRRDRRWWLDSIRTRTRLGLKLTGMKGRAWRIEENPYLEMTRMIEVPEMRVCIRFPGGKAEETGHW